MTIVTIEAAWRRDAVENQCLRKPDIYFNNSEIDGE
jgi:hypothetical protein